MKKLLTAAIVALTGCGVSASDEYRNAVPKSETVQMKVPGSTGQALETESTGQALEGDKAVFYEMTRGVSLMVNGAGYNILTLIKNITENEPTKLDKKEGVAIWGPHTEALSPNTWRLTVTKKSENDFTYSLDAKDKKIEGDAAFMAILSGEHVSTGKNIGHGTFVVDMDSAQLLPEHDADAFGKINYAYEHDAADADLKISSVFTQVKDKETGRFVNATYKYTSNEKTGGALEFQFQGDIQKDGSALENATLNSRWARNGAGRSDVKVAGGDLANGMEATASECWDSNFASRFLVASWDATAGYGSDSACGEMSGAQYSGLRL